MKQRVLFVDDEPYVLASLRRLLQRQSGQWDMTFLSAPVEALERLDEEDFDVVVLDVRMPVIDGLEVLSRMQEAPRTRDIPVIILTGEGDRTLKRRALELGATDLLSKPVDSEELKARLRSALRLKSYQDELKRQNEILAHRVRERTRELAESRLDIIWRLAKAAEYRDEETGNHVVRVGCYSRAVAATLGLDGEFVEAVYITAPLHDIGKIGIPDGILLKPGKLTADEWDTMKKHCVIGANILGQESKAMAGYLQWRGISPQEHRQRKADPTLGMALSIAMTHHEKWDGSGYPRGLAGSAIPLEGRIVAIADVFDALTSRRPYSVARSEQAALEILRDGRGQHFDPAVHDAFVDCFQEIRAARYALSDNGEAHRRAKLAVG